MYSRIGRRELYPTDRNINIPENYSGSAFNGGLIGELSNKMQDDGSATESAVVSTDMTGHVKMSDRGDDIDPSERECECDAYPSGDDGAAVSCALPGHMAVGTNESRILHFDNDQLLIIGLILLLNNGTLDEDILVLLILLLL